MQEPPPIIGADVDAGTDELFGPKGKKKKKKKPTGGVDDNATEEY
jgi:hypothetical protein